MDEIIKVLYPTLFALVATFIGWIVREIYKVKAVSSVQEQCISEHAKDIVELKTNQKEEIKEIKAKIDKMTDKLNELCFSFGEFLGYNRKCTEDKNGQ